MLVQTGFSCHCTPTKTLNWSKCYQLTIPYSYMKPIFSFISHFRIHIHTQQWILSSIWQLLNHLVGEYWSKFIGWDWTWISFHFHFHCDCHFAAFLCGSFAALQCGHTVGCCSIKRCCVLQESWFSNCTFRLRSDWCFLLLWERFEYFQDSGETATVMFVNVFFEFYSF
jgi:hypothetical protein